MRNLIVSRSVPFQLVPVIFLPFFAGPVLPQFWRGGVGRSLGSDHYVLLSLHVKNRLSEVTQCLFRSTGCLFVCYPSTDTLVNTLIAYIVTTGKLRTLGLAPLIVLINSSIGFLTSCVTLFDVHSRDR